MINLHRDRILKPLSAQAVLLLFITFQIAFSQDTLKNTPESFMFGTCSAKIVNESNMVLECPDSTTIKWHIVAEDSNSYLIQNDYLGSLRIGKNEVSKSTLLPASEHKYNPDPMKGSTFINQSAFIQREYPVGVTTTEGVFYSISASVTPSTIIWVDFSIPHNYRDFTFGIKQQLYQSRKKDLALSFSGSFTHVQKWDDPDFYDSNKGKLQYIVDGELLLSRQFFHNGYIHAGFLYTMQKRYFHNWRYIDGTEFHNFGGDYYHHFGLMACIEFQPIKFMKFFLDYSDGYGIFVNDYQTRNYYYAIGSRFLLRRVTLDLGACQNTNLKFIKLLPIFRFSCFLGSFRNSDLVKKPISQKLDLAKFAQSGNP